MLSRSCAGLVIFQQNYPAELICRRVGQDTLEQAIGQAVPKHTHASPRQGNKMRIWTTKPTYFCRQLMDLGVSQDDNLFHCPTLTSRRISTQDSSLCWKTYHQGLPFDPVQLDDLQVIGDQLALKWQGGEEQFIALEQLRNACPCASCCGEVDVMGRHCVIAPVQ